VSEALGAWKSWVLGKPGVEGGSPKIMFNQQKNNVIKNTTCKEKVFCFPLNEAAKILFLQVA